MYKLRPRPKDGSLRMAHSSLVLIFLNILPYTKHFHIITAVPNVFFGDLTPRGRLRPR